MPAQEKWPAPAAADVSGYGAGVQRTMRLLATSTPQKRNRVKILFYGQSITKQDWWQLVAADLRARFPHADAVIVNRAIGGFSTQYLKRQIEHDLYSFYPDLVIFHDYGSQPEYEGMIREIRSRTTAEVVVQTDHATTNSPAAGDEKELKRWTWTENHNASWLPELAKKYGLEIAFVREGWKKYLADNRLEPRALLTDSVHLNRQGEFLMAELVERHLRYDPKFAEPAGLVRDIDVGKDVKWEGGALRVEFEGNRVELISENRDNRVYARAEIRIDGKRPSEMPELYSFTRTSDTKAVDWPVIIRVDREKPLLTEDWFLEITKTDETNDLIHFKVWGTRTGPDGEGNSKERFVSKSGRVVIAPEDWHAKRAYDLRKVLCPVGFTVRWRAIAQFCDEYETPWMDDNTREYPTLAASGLANAKHTLELRRTAGETPKLKWIRVYRPPLQ
jgi:hypothetical protein